jgi:hypothetical protein
VSVNSVGTLCEGECKLPVKQVQFNDVVALHCNVMCALRVPDGVFSLHACEP